MTAVNFSDNDLDQKHAPLKSFVKSPSAALTAEPALSSIGRILRLAEIALFFARDVDSFPAGWNTTAVNFSDVATLVCPDLAGGINPLRQG